MKDILMILFPRDESKLGKTFGIVVGNEMLSNRWTGTRDNQWVE